MKTYSLSLLGLLLVLSTLGCSSAQKQGDFTPPPRRLEYSYAQLQLRDMDELKKLIAHRMNQGDSLIESDPSAVDEATLQYESAVRILFSRPDQDGARVPIFADIRKRLADIRTLDRVLQELADESIGAIRSDDATPVEKATYIHLLENLMSEIKPDIDSNPNMKDIIVQIRDAKLVIGDDVRNANLLRSMDPLTSPSRTADLILKKIEAPKKAKRKR